MSEFRSGLGERVAYDPDTGLFRWLVKPCKNRTILDAVGHTRKDGYLIVRVNGRDYLGHRLAWILMTGEDPPEEIDHIDGNPSNNKWSNLRAATRSQNMHNSRGYSNTGVKNVYYRRGKKNPYHVKLMCNGVRKTIGSFSSLELATLVAIEARSIYHGEFANER